METKKKKEVKRLTRRDFLKATGGAAALAGVGATGLVLNPRQVSATELPKKWDEEADVVIIGSGFAGLAAAIEAKNAAASTVVFEKMRVPGGNSIINGGLIAAADNAVQDKEGIKDSAEIMFNDMLKAGLGMNHPDLARTVADHSNEVVQWTIDYLGVKYKERMTHLGGHSVPRSYYTTNSSGSGIVRPQLSKVKELGIPLKTGCYLSKLIKDEDGRIKGVQIFDGYRFPKQNSGTSKLIKAKKAVILATGGFGYDISFRTIQDPRLTEALDCTNQPGATAEALLEALSTGATPVQPSWIQLGPWACPHEKGMGIGYIFAIAAAFPFGVMVDPATGKRFVSELADRKTRADAILKTGHYCVGIADQEGVQYVAKLDKMLSRGIVKKFNTLEDLASAFKINFQGLKETIRRYNIFVTHGNDEDFQKPFREGAKPIVKAPFYAMHLWPKVHHCMGGIQINTKAQVIGLNHKPIIGLYAAGEVTGGVHGACRLGSCAIADCLVFGRIAGKNAAAEKSWS